MDSDDPAPHLTVEFRQAFPRWADLRHYIADIARYPEYDHRRGLQQLLMADITARLPGVAATTSPTGLVGDSGWLLMASLSLPARVAPDWTWPAGYPDRPPISPAHVLARPAFDLDLHARLHILAPGRAGDASGTAPEISYGRLVEDLVTRHITGPPDTGWPGLGGLVRYRADLRLAAHDTQLMGVIEATPVDPTRGDGTPVDDPVRVEIDIKPPGKVVFAGPPEAPRQSPLGLFVPGFTAPHLRMPPTESLFADKACLLTGPAHTLRGTPSGPWHRYKDLFDLYYLTQAVPMRAGALRDALEENWNFARMARQALPMPYRVYGDASRPGDAYARDEPVIDWAGACERLRGSIPQLKAYPTFDRLSAGIARCLDTLPDAAPTDRWNPTRGWVTAQDPHPTSAVDLARKAYPPRTHPAARLPTTPPPDPGRPPPTTRQPGVGRDPLER